MARGRTQNNHQQALVEHKNYLYRISAILSARSLAEVAGGEFIDTHLVPLVVRMTGDPVPNVRFNAAKTIKAMHKVCMGRPQTFNDKLVPCLYKLLADEDPDVKFFAQKAGKSLRRGFYGQRWKGWEGKDGLPDAFWPDVAANCACARSLSVAPMDHDNENPDSSTKTIDVGQLPVSNGHVMISVRNKLSGTSMFSMRLNTDERVAELKGVIINMGGLNVNTWRQLLLFFKEDWPLEDTRRLADYGVREGDELQIVLLRQAPVNATDIEVSFTEIIQA
ncbi:pppA [Symbiodinium natans]|uniref:PppA protein n=1 Tax=Symbiodinium natans TaxID=878477 RepID=A0A812JS61_9DINO|nr:pppA [Symbiodinium natans]